MNEVLVILSAVLPVFLIAGVGAVLRRFDWLSPSADQSILRLTINVCYPALILETIIGNSALKQISIIIVASVIGFGSLVLGILLAWLCRKTARIQDLKQQRTFALSVGLFNYGYVPIPLVMMLFDQQTLGVLFVYNLGVEVGLWTVGLAVLTGATSPREWIKALTAPFYAILAGLFLNLLNFDKFIPGYITNTFQMLGHCAIPLGVLLIGATMADLFHEFHAKPEPRVIVVGGLIRLVILPVIFILVAAFLPIAVELKRVILIQAAMPAAVLPIVLAKHYGGDPATAMRVVISTTAASLVMTPFWIRMGSKLLGF